MAWLAGGPLLAHAHSFLVGSDPAQGATLERPPPEITLRFSRPVTPLGMRLIAGERAEIAATVRAERTTIRIAPAFPEAAAGPYVLHWRVAGADSHAVGGSVFFRIGAGPPVQGPSAAPPGFEHARRLGALTLRAATILGLLIAAGAALFRVLVAEPRGVPIRSAALVSLAALAGDYALMRATLGALAPVLGPAVVGLGLAAVWSGRRILAPLGALAALAGLSFWGHAAADTRALAQLLFVAHVVAAAFWLGALWPLYNVVRHGEGVSGILRRFWRLSLALVALLLGAGVALACLRLGSIEGLASAYGRVLALKVALVALLVALGAWNALRLAQRLPGSAPLLSRSIDFELALMAIVVVAAACLSALPPPGF